MRGFFYLTLKVREKRLLDVCSFIRSNREVGEFFNQGKLDIQLMPQGTMSESIRAGGAGIGGYYTRTSAGTELSQGKEVRDINVGRV